MLTNSKAGLVVVLLAVFLANYGETWLESSSHTQSPVSAADYRGAYAVHQFEPEFLNFEFHTRRLVAICAYSISYFVLFPVIALGVLLLSHAKRSRHSGCSVWRRRWTTS